MRLGGAVTLRSTTREPTRRREHTEQRGEARGVLGTAFQAALKPAAALDFEVLRASVFPSVLR